MQEQRVPRLRINTAFAALLCAVGAVAASCSSGSNCNTGPGTTSSSTLSTQLSTEYYLSYIQNSNGQTRPSPAKYADSAGFQLRVWNDTLTLALVDSTYVEHGRTGRLDPTTGDELLRTYKQASMKYAIATATSLTFPSFLGGQGAATVIPNYNRGLLKITASSDGSTWNFYPKYVTP